MKEKTARSIPIFLIRVMVIHTVTYIIAGILASNLMDYRGVFTLPVIRDYMVEFGTAPVFLGPVVQLLRGLIIGLVLLPFRGFLAGTRRGWLFLWLIFVGIGIVSTPAAAPASLEGVVYTRLPLWYHVFGLPEILLQTLAFSVLVHLYLRHPEGILSAMPKVFGVFLQSFAGACFAFIGYAVVSIIFAVVAGADVTAESNMSLRTQGLFLAPFLLNFALILLLNLSAHARMARSVIVFLAVLVSNAAAILLYQALVLDGIDVLYAVAAPVLPALILTLMSRAPAGSGKDSGSRRRGVRPPQEREEESV